MILDYLFAGLWFILAVYLFIMACKGHRFLFIVAPFFLFLGGWALANALTAVDLMDGVYGWIYRGVAILMLIICGIRYYFYKRKQ